MREDTQMEREGEMYGIVSGRIRYGIDGKGVARDLEEDRVRPVHLILIRDSKGDQTDGETS